MRQLDIHIVGFDKTPDQVIRGLKQHFGLPRDAAERFIKSVPRVARHCADPTEARAYEETLRAIGAIVEVRQAESLTPRPDLDMPSLPAPHTITSTAPQYDSSAKLAAQIPRAAAVPAEAWHKPAPGAADEFGNPVDGAGELVMSPAALAKAKRERDATPHMPIALERSHSPEVSEARPLDPPKQEVASVKPSAASSPASMTPTGRKPQLWLGVVALAALIACLWLLTR